MEDRGGGAKLSRYRDLVLSKSPNAFWIFDDPVHTASALVLDASGNGRHGTYVGNDWANTTPPPGLASVAKRNSVGSYATLASAALSNGPTTLEIWVYLSAPVTSTTPDRTVIGTQSSNTYGLALGSATSGLSNEVLSLGTSSSSNRVGWTGITVPPGWRHFALVRPGSSSQVWSAFIDGKDVVTDLGGTFLRAGSGASFTNQTWTVAYFDGRLYKLEGVSSFAIYNYALTQEDIALHAAIGAGSLYLTSLAPVVY